MAGQRLLEKRQRRLRNCWHGEGGLIFGRTIASFCIPQDIGYAKLANLSPQCGLYSSIVLPLIYMHSWEAQGILPSDW
ncbi:hypothetical protein V6N11_012053 [Hibiscus sabdariffa]|uniref:SLC26A/SulP transporter domain-containing protein n=1 Tax=Hibiscus sabdariffa TaxID=183260 RepID=A0ABR2A1N6_9ROSI